MCVSLILWDMERSLYIQTIRNAIGAARFARRHDCFSRDTAAAWLSTAAHYRRLFVVANPDCVARSAYLRAAALVNDESAFNAV
jgi:hypothetical protein